MARPDLPKAQSLHFIGFYLLTYSNDNLCVYAYGFDGESAGVSQSVNRIL